MSRIHCKLTLACWALGAAAGCQPPCPPVELDTAGLRPAASCEDLAAALTLAVRRNGLANPDGLRKAAPALDAQVRLMAITGPTATPKLYPTPEHAIAYWYNAHAAWSMKLLLLEECPRTILRVRLEEREFPLDGRRMSLLAIERLLARDSDFRTAVAVPGATIEHARLPTEPFRGEGIRQRIAERFAELIDDGMRFRIDIPSQRVLVPPALWQFRQRLTEGHDARYGTVGANLLTALMPYVSGSPLRRLQDAIGYRAVESRPRKLATVPPDP